MGDMKVLEAFVAAAGLPSLDDTEKWATLAKWWRHEGRSLATVQECATALEAQCAELASVIEGRRQLEQGLRDANQELTMERDAAVRELADFRRQNEKLIDTLNLTVPAPAVRTRLLSIVERCTQVLPAHATLDGWAGQAGDQQWHSLFREILDHAVASIQIIDNIKTEEGPPWLSDAAAALGEVTPDGKPLALSWTQVLGGIRELRSEVLELRAKLASKSGLTKSR